MFYIHDKTDSYWLRLISLSLMSNKDMDSCVSPVNFTCIILDYGGHVNGVKKIEKMQIPHSNIFAISRLYIKIQNIFFLELWIWLSRAHWHTIISWFPETREKRQIQFIHLNGHYLSLALVQRSDCGSEEN